MSEIVVPGERLEEGEPGDNVYESGGENFAETYGFKRRYGEEVSVLPLKEKYVPEEGDRVVGIVEDLGHSSWQVEIGSPYEGTLHVSRVDEHIEQNELEDFLAPGDALVAGVDEVDREKNVELTLDCHRCGPIREGQIVAVEPTKVPRIIGSEGSMVKMIGSRSGAEIFIGNNGRIWVKGGGVDLAIETVEFVADHAHEKNLTEKVERFMEEYSNG